MIRIAAFLALGLSLAACGTAVESSGASGLANSNYGAGMRSDHGYGRGVGIDACAPDDINCRIIYNGKGGG